MRPGDSVFEHLDRLEIQTFPKSNLPKDIPWRLNEPIRLRTPPLEDWFPAGPRPPHTREALKDRPDVVYRRHDIGAIYRKGRRLTLLKDGLPVKPWDPASEPFPECVLWIDGTTLFALSVHRPQNVQLEYRATGLDIANELDPSGTSMSLDATDLVRRELIGVQSRPCLAAHAPSRMSFSVDELQANGLRFSIGVADRAWRLDADALEETTQLSDGVRFSIEIEIGKSRSRVWTRDIERMDIGKSYTTCEVPLDAYRGRPITLHFVTETLGHGHFDYSLWAGLRFYGPTSRKPERPNVILVDIDTLRADRLGFMGYSKQTTPRLDEWTSEHAIVYTNALSNSPWTLPSTASILTGLSLAQHGVTRYPRKLTPKTPPLALMLRSHGYESFAMVEQGFLDPAFGFDLGFDVYNVRGKGFAQWTEATDWIEGRESERPFFMFLHTYLVHAPLRFDPTFVDPEYQGPLAHRQVGPKIIRTINEQTFVPDADDIAYINAIYDGAVRRADDLVGDFLDEIADLGLLEDSLIIFFSDHGEEILERGWFGHSHTLYNELLHVPLAVRPPGPSRPRVDPSPVSTLDIVPTVLETLGLPNPSPFLGHDLLNRPEDPILRVASDEECRLDALAIGDFKLIRFHPPSSPNRYDTKNLLFNLSSDPEENTDLSRKERERTGRLIRILENFHQSQVARDAPRSQDARPGWEQTRALQQLGYLNEGQALPRNPKDTR